MGGYRFRTFLYFFEARSKFFARVRRYKKPNAYAGENNLDLGLLEAVLPDDNVGGGAVLAVVEEDNHAVGVHGLAGVELPVLELGEDDVLGEGTGLGLEVLDLLGGLALLLEGGLDGLHVACCFNSC